MHTYLTSERIAHPFRGHCCTHQRYDIANTARQLKHDDDKRNRHSSDTTQHCSCTNHRIEARLNAIVARRTLARKNPILWIIVRELFHADAYNPPHYCAEAERWNEEATRDFDAKSEDSHDQLHYHRQNEQPNGFVYAWPGGCNLNGLIYVGKVAIVITKKLMNSSLM